MKEEREFKNVLGRLAEFQSWMDVMENRIEGFWEDGKLRGLDGRKELNFCSIQENFDALKTAWQEPDSEMHGVNREPLKERILEHHKKLKEYDMAALGAIRSRLAELQSIKSKRMSVYRNPHETKLQRRKASEVQWEMVPEVGESKVVPCVNKAREYLEMRAEIKRNPVNDNGGGEVSKEGDVLG